MSRSQSFFASTIGRKVVVAVTGVLMFGFVIAHMLGNLQMYLGAEAFNAYGASLREILHGGGLWIARGGLLTAVVLHIWATISLTLDDRAARPVAYKQWTPRQSTYASRSMRWTGLFLLAFLIYHLLDLTIGTVNPGFEEGNVYRNVVASLRIVPVSLFYLAAMLMLGMHLRHGTYSFLQTLGFVHPRHQRAVRAVAGGFAALVVLGNLSFPIAVLLGIVR